jgi:hypothetical protein
MNRPTRPSEFAENMYRSQFSHPCSRESTYLESAVWSSSKPVDSEAFHESRRLLDTSREYFPRRAVEEKIVKVR